MTFKDFFRRATDQEDPFPYQESLATADLTRLALAAPTGAGKTAAAVLAWLWQRRQDPEHSPKRLILCEPQRTLVEQVYNEIQKWLSNLDLLANKGDHLLGRSQREKVSLHALQGGFIDEEWELCPEQPAIIVGTQDQLLSRALNRGYAMSRFRWPIHFGLFHNDAQWVFDEIQLMGPALGTSAQLHGLREKLGTQAAARSLWMSATLNSDWLHTVDHHADETRPLPIHPFTDQDKEKLAQRLKAAKPLTKLLHSLDSQKKDDVKSYIQRLSDEVAALHQPGRFTLVIVNTVDRAKKLYEALKKAKVAPDHLLLLHSRFRPVERKEILERALQSHTERLLISTQVVEAGVDFSADVLVTELAPRSSMIQRFGRCNRKGEQNDTAHVYWTDIKGDAAAPYLASDLESARDCFESMSSVEPAQFSDRVNEPWPIYDTLRRKDLLELFDTTNDLSGLPIDVGRFIRDGEERDLFLYWRDFPSERPEHDITGPDHHEVCKVTRSEVREALKKGKEFWLLDDFQDTEGRWRPAKDSDLVPGRTFLVKSEDGLYDPETGFDASYTKTVRDVSDPKDKPNPFPTMGGDPYSSRPPEVVSYLTLWDHTKDVCEELDGLIESPLGLSAEQIKILKLSALWHDVGKAHQVFQGTMLDKASSDISRETLWAKRIGKAYHSRRYFRHELASALAALQQGLPLLACYLIAAHHGKARVSIRSFPEEEHGRILGIEEGDTLPAIDFPDLKIEATTLDLHAFRLGVNSWQDRCLELLEQHGPFRLAYLEALLRAADVRASIKEKREVPA